MPGTRGWFCRRRRTRANDPHAADRVRGLPVGRSGIAAERGAAAEREGGSALFAPPTGPAHLNNPASWWRYRKGADWIHPDGPRQQHRRAGGLARHPFRLSGCGGICALGWRRSPK